MYKTTILAVLAVLCMLPVAAHAQLNGTVDQIDGIDITEHLGEKIPLDLELYDERGTRVKLADYFGQGKPVLLQLVYVRCPMLCTLVVNGTLEALEDTEIKAGKDFDMVTVSFVGSETPEMAKVKKNEYLKQYDFPGSADAWHFLTAKGDWDTVNRLADSVGFKYKYIKERDEYSHQAAIFFLAPDGTISRYMYGVEYDPTALKYSLDEASGGRTVSTTDRIFLFCFQYDHATGQYTPVVMNIMKLGGAATLLVLGLFMGGLWARERRRNLGFEDDEEADGPEPSELGSTSTADGAK